MKRLYLFICFAMLLAISSMAVAAPASYASTGSATITTTNEESPTSAPTEDDIPSDPMSSLKDSQGVPAEKFLTTPVDRGDIWNPRHVIDGWFIDLLWGPYTGAFKTMMWLIHFVFSFTWVDWLISPVKGVSDNISEVITPIKSSYIGFAMALSGAVYGFALLRGRAGKAIMNIAVTLGILVLLMGSLSNPMNSIFGNEGSFDKFRNAGNEIAITIATNGEQNTQDLTANQVITDSVGSKLTDVMLREPLQYVAFGKTLDGKCDEVFTQKIQEVATGDGKDTRVRKAVSNCDDQAKAYLETPTGTLDVMAGSTMMLSGMLIFVIVFFAILAGAVLFLAWRSIVLFYQLLIGLLPGGERGGLWECLVMVLYGLFLTGFALALFVVVLLAIVGFLDFLAPLGRNKFTVVMVFTIVSAVLLFKYRSWLVARAKKLAERMKNTLGDQGGQSRPVNVGGAISSARRAAHTVSNIASARTMSRTARSNSEGPDKAEQTSNDVPSKSPSRAASAVKGATARKAQNFAQGKVKAAALLAVKGVPGVGTAVTAATVAGKTISKVKKTVNAAKTHVASGQLKTDMKQRKVDRLQGRHQQFEEKKGQKQERTQRSMDRLDQKIVNTQKKNEQHPASVSTPQRMDKLTDKMKSKTNKAAQISTHIPKRHERVQAKLAAAQKVRDSASKVVDERKAHQEMLKQRAAERRASVEPEPIKVKV
ncbi:hypothetical protein ACTXPA_17765 [Glutamicibacter arilaitensis]|uniref:hypothetical protein n=1 Tax=Glutamicibacter arilaitensis TaxID=256701 RepID=UPI003FD4842C